MARQQENSNWAEETARTLHLSEGRRSRGGIRRRRAEYIGEGNVGMLAAEPPTMCFGHAAWSIAQWVATRTASSGDDVVPSWMFAGASDIQFRPALLRQFDLAVRDGGGTSYLPQAGPRSRSFSRRFSQWNAAR